MTAPEQTEPMRAWAIKAPELPSRKYATLMIVIGTRADAENKCYEVGGHFTTGPYEFTIAVKP